MIYLNDIFKNAGTLINYRTNKRDIEVDNKIDIDIINIIFNKYSVIPNKGVNNKFAYLNFKKTIINIYKNKDNIL